jgi:ribosomal protein S18 acetylase RimI-like enzyme
MSRVLATFTKLQLPPLDLQIVVEQLDQLLDQESWSEAIWRETWMDFHCFSLLTIQSDVEKKLLGFALISQPPFDDTRHLLKLVVSPNCRRSGCAKALLEELKKQKAPIFLEVDVNNEGAIAFYASEGFKVMHRAKNFYGQTGHDALKMLHSPFE